MYSVSKVKKVSLQSFPLWVLFRKKKREIDEYWKHHKIKSCETQFCIYLCSFPLLNGLLPGHNFLKCLFPTIPHRTTVLTPLEKVRMQRDLKFICNRLSVDNSALRGYQYAFHSWKCEYLLFLTTCPLVNREAYSCQLQQLQTENWSQTENSCWQLWNYTNLPVYFGDQMALAAMS